MSDARLTVHIELDLGQDMAGTMHGDSDEHDMAFDGWIGFMEALQVLRRRAGDTSDRP